MKRCSFTEEHIIGIPNEHKAGMGESELYRNHGPLDQAGWDVNW